MANSFIDMRPKAVVQGRIDRTRSHWEKMIEYPLISTANFTDNGVAMIYTSETGIDQQVVDVAAGVANEDFAGIAFSDFRRITELVEVVAVTIPAATPFTVQLKKTTPIVASAFVVESDGTVYTVGAGADQFTLSAGGLLTFNVANAGASVTVRFRYIPTNVELNSRFPQPAFVQQGQTFLNQVAVAVGFCEIFTMAFDTSRTYTLREQLFTGPAGLLTDVATAVTEAGRVISLPSVGDPYLGIAYQIGSAHT